MKQIFKLSICIGLTCLFCCGCKNTSYDITVENNSGEKLTDVGIFAFEKSFTFGVLPDQGEKSFMDANSKFGAKKLEALSIQFTTKSSESIRRSEINISNAGNAGNSIRVIIDSNYQATGKFE